MAYMYFKKGCVNDMESEKRTTVGWVIYYVLIVILNVIVGIVGFFLALFLAMLSGLNGSLADTNIFLTMAIIQLIPFSLFFMPLFLKWMKGKKKEEEIILEEKKKEDSKTIDIENIEDAEFIDKIDEDEIDKK